MARLSHNRSQAAAARPRAALLACAMALLGLAGGGGASFAQTGVPSQPTPPATPSPPDPDAPQTPVSPGDPDGEPSPSPEGPGPSDPSPSDPNPSQDESRAGPAKLKPFPVVVIAGRQGKRTTTVSELSIRGPRNARVRMRCLGEGCPVRRARATIGPSKRLRLRRGERVYRAGTAIEIRVTGTDRVGKYTKVKFRSGRTPKRTDSCLQPGATRPSPCPEG